MLTALIKQADTGRPRFTQMVGLMHHRTLARLSYAECSPTRGEVGLSAMVTLRPSGENSSKVTMAGNPGGVAKNTKRLGICLTLCEHPPLEACSPQVRPERHPLARMRKGEGFLQVNQGIG